MIRFVGKGGSDANNGLTWATRKLTLTGAEDTPVVAGDTVYVGAGTYRELLTVDVSGGNTYTSGTVSVIQGSAVVTGIGTLWLSNVAPDYIFHSTVLASGADGVTTNVTGTSHTFSSAAGNFQSGHVGYTIRINTIGAFVITAVGGATSITVAKTDNSSFVMTAGTGLTYNVGPEQPYDILRVDSDTQITLKKAWSAPSFTGLAYLTYNPIRYLADYLGTFTDGVGGVVRVTGSDNDQTATRAQCINAAAARNYRTWQGFTFDTTTGIEVNNTNGLNWIVDKCYFAPSAAQCFDANGASASGNTIQNCYFYNRLQHSVFIEHSSAVNNAAHLIQNCLFLGGGGGVRSDRVGGVTVRNNSFLGHYDYCVRVVAAVTVGQTVTVNNCIVQGVALGFQATAVGEVTEDYNSLFAASTSRTNVLTGANSKTYPALLDTRWFFQLVFAGAGPYSPTQMVATYDLSAESQIINLAGFNPSAGDIRGTSVQNSQREWGATEFDPTLSIKARQASSIGGMVV